MDPICPASAALTPAQKKLISHVASLLRKLTQWKAEGKKGNIKIQLAGLQRLYSHWWSLQPIRVTNDTLRWLSDWINENWQGWHAEIKDNFGETYIIIYNFPPD